MIDATHADTLAALDDKDFRKLIKEFSKGQQAETTALREVGLRWRAEARVFKKALVRIAKHTIDGDVCFEELFQHPSGFLFWVSSSENAVSCFPVELPFFIDKMKEFGKEFEASKLPFPVRGPQNR